jgi:hypothetical protein
MSVYTVHEPPVRRGDPLPDAERIVFVRDGFSFWAFLLAPLWMLWHRMWLVFIGYVIVVAGLETLLAAFDASPGAISVVSLFISLLVGLEASTLRRFSLRRRRWTNVGIVSGDDVEDAERRFFDAWLRAPSAQRANGVPPTPAAGAPAAMLRARQGSGVIGLFPEPGAHR